MIETLKKQWQAKVLLLLLVVLTLWWFTSPSVTKNVYEDKRFFGDFGSIYGIMALWGGIWGLKIAQKWGLTKSVMGKAIMMFSLGLLAQVFGQLAYAYFSFYQHIAVPYPSIGDIGYFGSIPLYIYGIFLLAKASQVKLSLQSLGSKIQALIIPLIMLSIGYFLFLRGYQIDWSDPIKVFLDFGYPLAQAIYISLAILTYLLSKNILGGLMRNKILLILVALCIQFASDYTFLYQSSKGTWSVGGINDYMYLVAYTVMTFALLHLNPTLLKFKSGDNNK